VGQYCGGLWTIETPQLWLRSMKASAKTCFQGLEYLRDFMTAAANGEITDPAQIAKVSLITFALSALFYVLIVAPLMAGMWTGQRARRHRIHRYMGLSYLIQYTFVWVEFLTNYNQDGFLTSILPHTIALNGMIQGYSAFFSFSVLPDLEDPGYYSDKVSTQYSDFCFHNCFFYLTCSFLLFEWTFINKTFPTGRRLAKLHSRKHFLHLVLGLWILLLQPFGARKLEAQLWRTID
jgi:hypothetical protein